jgi:opacity protein-like surface antigen
LRKTILAAAAAAALSSPAMARDGQGYFGLEGGVLFPRDHDIDITLDGTDETFSDGFYPDAVELDYKMGVDLDLIAGYDFGMFRIEGELGYKRASLDADVDADFADAVAADVGLDFAFADFDLNDKATVLSGMVNALAEFGDDDGLTFYGGAGFGRARVKIAGEKDSAWAWQLIAGVRYALSDSIDLGLKYRYFSTGKLDLLDDDDILFTDGSATATADFDPRFRSHSLLASLTFNFGGAEAPPPPPPPAPYVAPPAPPPPATQTCPDGSVILATDACPPPPPPPPPPPEPERG